MATTHQPRLCRGLTSPLKKSSVRIPQLKAPSKDSKKQKKMLLGGKAQLYLPDTNKVTYKIRQHPVVTNLNGPLGACRNNSSPYTLPWTTVK
mmetsp:Transcript_35986/g.62800  ORF Transcript_35986/g.62800 Transcript_35986/m.62800 type:complete len:92 (+) Transcript_35986:336-611(+)